MLKTSDTFDETIDLLLSRSFMLLLLQTNSFYDNVREKSQWTLDRGQRRVSKDNLVVSCYRAIPETARSEAFKF